MLVIPVLVQGLEQRAAAIYKLRLQWKIFKSWQYYCLFMATGVSASPDQNAHVNFHIYPPFVIFLM